MFSEHYAGLHVSVRSAQRVEGQGLYVRGLSIKDPHLEGPRGELLYVDEIFMASNCAIEDLVLGDLQIDRISVRRPAVRAVRNSQGEWSIKNLLPFPSLGGAMPSATIEDGTLEIFDPTHNPPSTLTVRRINLEVEPPTASSTSGSPNLLGVKGTFAGDVFAETTVHGWLDPESGQWSARGEVKRLIVAPETWQTLPDVVASQLTGLGNLRGKADVQFDIVHRQIDVTTPLPLDHYLAEAPCQFHVRGKLVDGRYEDAGLPLPLRNISADFEISNQHLAVTNLLADGGSATLQLDLRRDGWADDSPLHLQAKARQFHVDDAVADVLPSELATVWRAYQPRGLMNADIVVDFDGEHWKPELTVHCLNTSFLYEAFPYPVSGTTGVISLKDDVLDFSLSAMASEKPVNMRGRFEDALATPVGWMEFHCDGPIPVDARMMAALDTPDLRYTRDLIASMNARGNVASSGRFDIVRLPSGATQLKEHIFFRISDASVEYEGFPFPVHHVSGEIELWNGQYTFREVKGENDSARIACTGSYLDDGKDPQLTLNYVCQDIPLEEELRRAFSPEIQDVWSSLRPQGTIDRLNVKVR